MPGASEKFLEKPVGLSPEKKVERMFQKERPL